MRIALAKNTCHMILAVTNTPARGKQKQALQQTEDVFPALRSKIWDTIQKLKTVLRETDADEASPDDLSNAKDALNQGEELLSKNS